MKILFFAFLILLTMWLIYNDFDINLQETGGIVWIVGVIADKNVE